jgi:crotonobetainyl-CoA:carnitine CoA-transferase CaiB-like acyl-CoA transferase
VYTLSSDIISTTIPDTVDDPSVTPNRRLGGYRTKDDRLIIMSILNESHWPMLVRAIGRADLADDPRFNTRDSRIQNNAVYEAEVTETFASKTYDEWCVILRASDAPWAPVQSASEVGRDPQVLANNYLSEVDSGEGFTYFLANAPVEFNETPIALGRAPGPGQHTEEVLLDLGLTWDEIIQLKIDDVLA